MRWTTVWCSAHKGKVLVDEWKTNLMSLAILFHLLCAQHVSDINISIFRSLRLCWWITKLKPAKRTPPNTDRNKSSNTQRTENKTTDVVIHQHSRMLPKMDILMSETCWAHKKWNKIASDIKLVFHSSTITMLHGPINIRWCTGLLIWGGWGSGHFEEKKRWAPLHWNRRVFWWTVRWQGIFQSLKRRFLFHRGWNNRGCNNSELWSVSKFLLAARGTQKIQMPQTNANSSHLLSQDFCVVTLKLRFGCSKTCSVPCRTLMSNINI